MVATTTKIAMILLFMNTILYLGMGLATSVDNNRLQDTESFRLNGDILDKVISTSLNDMIDSNRENFTDYNIVLNDEFSKYPTLEGGENTGVGGVSFLDIIRMVSPVLKTIFNIIISPITLFTTSRLPFFFLVLVGLPYLIMGVLSLILIIRGVGD